MAGGRPSKYKPDQLALVYKYAEAGLTNEQIANLLDVSVRTLYRWMAEYPEFCHALKEEKEFCDSRVEASLFQRALGYWGFEEKVTKDGDVVRVTKFYPPDTTACIFWLKNRQPEKWRQNPEFTGVTDAESLTLTVNGNEIRIA